MKLHVDIPEWLGLAVALRLKRAAGNVEVSVTSASIVDRRPLSAAGVQWLKTALSHPSDLLAGATLDLAIARDHESLSLRNSDLVAVDHERLRSALLAEAMVAGVRAEPEAPRGALVAGIGSCGRRVRRRIGTVSSVAGMRLQFSSIDGAGAHLRLYPFAGGTQVELLWPTSAMAPDEATTTWLMELAGIEGCSLGNVAEVSGAVDFDLALEDDLLCLGSGEQVQALVETLASCLADPAMGDEKALRAAFETTVRAARDAAQHATRNRLDWFANYARYRALSLPRFAYGLLSATQRVAYDGIAVRHPDLIERVEREIALGSGAEDSVAPMFAPFRLRGMAVPNRIVVSPMCMYSASDGAVGDFHLVHLGARAMGGAGLVLSEMTAVAEEGRITPGCAGIYHDRHIEGWRRIVRFVHENSPARIGIQLGHAGPKASTQLGWQRMDEPLSDGNWPIIAASAIAYGPRNQTPRAMTGQDMDRLEQCFVGATSRAAFCGFDMIELHFAHGYLLSSFISPLTNLRTDEYGGPLENRMVLPVRVLRAVRAVWPGEKPISVRISACDWAEGGLEADEAVEVARLLKEAGADAITVSSGQTTRAARPLYGRMYQVPLSDRIRNDTGIPTIAVGAITDADQVNGIVAAGRADLCALARPHLVDAAWTLNAAVRLGHAKQRWPKQYLAGKAQAERESGRRPRQGAA